MLSMNNEMSLSMYEAKKKKKKKLNVLGMKYEKIHAFVFNEH